MLQHVDLNSIPRTHGRSGGLTTDSYAHHILNIHTHAYAHTIIKFIFKKLSTHKLKLLRNELSL